MGATSFSIESPSLLALCGALALTVTAPIPGRAQQPDGNVVYDPALYAALEYRSIGPYRGGRVTAVTGLPSDPLTYFMGSTGGGVWKTDDGGTTWTNVSDAHFEAGSMGALAVADSDPNVIYAGTGSACIRGNVSTGIGMYRSTDGGDSWSHVGLDDAGQIARVRVHPDDPDLVYVAALGHAFGPNPERGVFRSRDGGATWENVLFLSDSTGAVDLSMDAHNPRVLYASMWRAERKPWTLISGALEGGIYKTTDGGNTWTELTHGLPQGPTGRIGISVSPANSDRVWALVEAHRGDHGLYRSDDGGETWQRINGDPELVDRSWYYNHVIADPIDENTVYVASDDFWKSVDGGLTFEVMGTPHGDNHDLWINPHDNRVMIEGNDGGANVSFNGGETWSPQTNQPTAEFYSVTVDDAFPYRVYGPQQDNSTISVPSRVAGQGITIQHWIAVGGCETGPISVDPRDPNVIYANCYAGRLTRLDRRTEQSRQIGAYPEAQLGTPALELRNRFQWNAPVLASRHRPGTLYYASQHVHRSTDQGQSWEVISPELTRHDPALLGFAGEPITRDMTGVEIYSAILAIAESPIDPEVLWVGSNDGLIHVSRDQGETWTDVTPPGLPEWSTVSTIDPSPHEPGRALAAVYRYRMDDFQPYAYRTDDYGRTWTLLTDGTNGIPSDHPVRVVREDPDRDGLLYAGTEFGLFVSFDGGTHWQSLQQNLPHTPVTDLRVHQQDLVVATQGRSFWILDDVTPLHHLTPQVASADAYLFPPRPAYRGNWQQASGGYSRDPVNAARLDPAYVGENSPAGAMIFYTLAGEPEGGLTLEILDIDGRPVRSFTTSGEAEGRPGALPTRPGLNRFVWDLRYPGAEGPVAGGGDDGPRAVPGEFQVRLASGSWSQTRSLSVLRDPRIETSLDGLQDQFDLLIAIRDRLQDVNDAVRAIREVREQADELTARLGEGAGEVRGRAEALVDRLSALESELVRVPSGPMMGYDRPRYAREFDYLSDIVSSADAQPTDQAVERYEELRAGLVERLEELEGVLEEDLGAFNRLLRDRGIGPVIVPAGRGAGRVAADGT